MSGRSSGCGSLEDLTQSEIGARLGISQMHVSRMIRQIVDRLREAAEHETSPGVALALLRQGRPSGWADARL